GKTRYTGRLANSDHLPVQEVLQLNPPALISKVLLHPRNSHLRRNSIRYGDAVERKHLVRQLPKEVVRAFDSYCVCSSERSKSIRLFPESVKTRPVCCKPVV